MRRCTKSEVLIHDGDWVEIISLEGEILYSFTSYRDMCPDMFKRFIVFRAGIDPQTEYKLKVRRKK